MKIEEYFKNFNRESQKHLQKSLENTDVLAKSHYIASSIHEFSSCLFDNDERNMLLIVCTQLETATFNLSLGMYREAFSSLRLAFEIGLGVIYFSIHKLQHSEWIKGGDLRWSWIIDKDNGVLTKRFSHAFFTELSEEISDFREKAIVLYRNLSEYVHGNNETWRKDKINIKFNSLLYNKYHGFFNEVSEILLFTLSCRYLKSLTEDDIDSLIFLNDELRHIKPIRDYLSAIQEEN